MEFRVVQIGGKGDIATRATHRLVATYEARRNLTKIKEGAVWEDPWQTRVRLKNGYMADGIVQEGYEMGTLAKDDLHVAMAYACEKDDWQEVEELVKLAGPGILAEKLPHKDNGTVLHVCAFFDSRETLGRLLKLECIHPEVNNGGYDETPLHTAVEEGNARAAKLILEIEQSKKMLNAGNCYGNTPLHHSTKTVRIDCLELILGAEGLQLDIQNGPGQTVLHLAVMRNNLQFVNAILMHPAAADLRIIDKPDYEGQTPLHIAASNGYHEICRRLLEYDALPEVQDNSGKTPLAVAKSRQDFLTIVMDRLTSTERCLSICVSSYNLVNWKFESGSRALHIATLTGSVELMQALVRAGAFLDVVNDKGDTPLHIAVRRGDMEVFKWFLSLEEEEFCFSTRNISRQQWLSMPNSLDLDTVLHIALRNHSIQMSLDLINGQAFVNGKNIIGETPLHIAAREADLQVFQRLLQGGSLSPGTSWRAWVRTCDLDGETALHEAVRRGDEAVIDELLRSGPDHDHMNNENIDDLLLMKDIDNRTALHYALQQPLLLRKLLERAEDVETRTFLMWNLASADLSGIPAEIHDVLKQVQNSTTNNVNDLLAGAVKIKDLRMATELLSNGADVTQLNVFGRAWLSDSLCEKASDRPARKDSLGRKQLVDGIAALLLSPFTATPITIGIFGAWGTGKSSVMFQVEEALLEIAVNEHLRRSSSQFRSKVLKQLYGSENEDFEENIEYRPEHRQLFKDLASTHPSTLVSKRRRYTDVAATLKDVGQIPAVVTVSYNAWRYQDKVEASAGLAIQISEELERSMSGPQRLQMCWSYSWELSQSKDIFVQFVLPVVLAMVALMFVALLWKVVPIKNAYKALSLPGLLGAALLLLHTWMGKIPSVAQKILGYVQTPDHRAILGYQHKVIRDINFLKEQLCKPPNIWWIILGYFTQWCTQNTGATHGVRIKGAPPRDNLRIVVFIDDLDRCDQSIILELLSAINLILAECQINVVLGIDKSMVQRAIAKAFLKVNADESDPSNAQYIAESLADKYLQKIIQLPVQLPDLDAAELTTFLEAQIGHRSRVHHSSTVLITKQNISPVSGDFEDAIISTGENVYDSVQPYVHAIPIPIDEEPAIAEPSTQTHHKKMRPKGTPFPLILANYSQSEVDMLRGLCAQTQAGDQRLPREWKRFLNYHRLVSNILLQEDHSMKSRKLKSWRRKLIVWIFICWNWTREMNKIIETWDDLIFEAQMGWEGAQNAVGKETARPDDGEKMVSVGDAISRRLSALEESYLDDIQTQEVSVGDAVSLGDVVEVQLKRLQAISDAEKRKWRELRRLLKGENDLTLEFIDVFQRFRFYCELEHLKINATGMVKTKRSKKKTQ